MRNTAASVRQRLFNRAKERGEDVQLTLIRYANERLLYRLSRSEHRERFVLKGATLFSVWSGDWHRATRDIDLLGKGSLDEAALKKLIVAIVSVDCEDGLIFDAASIKVGPIREGQEYEGLRVTFNARIDSVRLKMQVDVGTGDAYGSELVQLPSLLGMPEAQLPGYAKESVIAEKLEAMVRFGSLNSRMKDFYDVATLAEEFSFEGITLVSALRTTFARRKTQLPTKPLRHLLDHLREQPSKTTEWKGFMRKAGPKDDWTFEEVLEKVSRFMEEPLQLAQRETSFTKTWEGKGPWK